MLKMHDSLKEASNRNKKLLAKNDALERANSKLIRELNTVKELCRQMQNKDKYYENIKKNIKI